MEGLNPNALGPPDQSDKGLQEESNSDEEDAELARLLESASGMAASLPQDGGSRKKKRKFDSDDEITGDGGEQQAYYYDDFFGRGGMGPPEYALLLYELFFESVFKRASDNHVTFQTQ